MYINKGIQSIAKNISDKTNKRPQLASVYFKGNTAVATDSFKLMEVVLENKELPEIRKFKKGENENVLISSKDILDIKIPKEKNEVYNNIQIGNINENEVSLAITDGKKEVVTNTSIRYGKFPEYENFFPETNFKVGIGIDHLMDILKVYKDLGEKVLVFKFNTNDNSKAILIENNNKLNDIEKTRTILMPIEI